MIMQIHGGIVIQAGSVLLHYFESLYGLGYLGHVHSFDLVSP
jgi:hypothetical protein